MTECRVANVFAFKIGSDDDAVGKTCRHVLGRMNRQINPAFKERNVDFLGEKTLATDLKETAVLDAVSGGGNDDERRHLLGVLRRSAKRSRDASLHLASLGKGELGAAGPDPDRRLRRHGGRATSKLYDSLVLQEAS